MVVKLGVHAPRPPTATPVLASVNQTPLSELVVPLGCISQLTPPSAVRRITPPKLPTVVTVSGSIIATAWSQERISVDCGVHVTPPSVVLRIVLASPTIVP